MEVDSIVMVLRGMRILEAFVASIAIAAFTAGVIALTMYAKSLIARSRKPRDLPS